MSTLLYVGIGLSLSGLVMVLFLLASAIKNFTRKDYWTATGQVLWMLVFGVMAFIGLDAIGLVLKWPLFTNIP